jgi:hypothetical protein
MRRARFCEAVSTPVPLHIQQTRLVPHVMQRGFRRGRVGFGEELTRHLAGR